MDSSADPNGAKRKRSPSDVLPPARPAPSTPSAAAPSKFRFSHVDNVQIFVRSLICYSCGGK